MGVAAQHAFKTGPGSRGELWVCHSSASGLAFPSCGRRIRAWGPCPASPAGAGPCFSPAQPRALCPCPSNAAGCWSLAPLTLTPACRLTAHPVPHGPAWPSRAAAEPGAPRQARSWPRLLWDSPAQPSLGPCPWRCLCIITAERPRLPSSPAGPAPLLRYCGTGPALQPCYGFWLPFLPQGAAGLRWALTEVCLLLHFPITSS